MLLFLNDTVLEGHVDINFSLKIKHFKDFQQSRSNILNTFGVFLNFFWKETDWIITTASKIPWTGERGETQKFINIFCPPLLYLNCIFHTSLRHPLEATPAEDKRSRKVEVEVPGLAADIPKSELQPSVIHSLDINIFPSIKNEPGWYSAVYDSGKRQWRSYFMSFVLLSILMPTENRQPDGCYQCMAPLNSPWIPRGGSPGIQMRLSSCHHHRVFHPLLTSYESAVNYCHLYKSVSNTGSQMRVREVNSEPIQNQSLVSTLINIANATNKLCNAEMWVQWGWNNYPVSSGFPFHFQLWGNGMVNSRNARGM